MEAPSIDLRSMSFSLQNVFDVHIPPVCVHSPLALTVENASLGISATDEDVLSVFGPINRGDRVALVGSDHSEAVHVFIHPLEVPEAYDTVVGASD